jgi:hypothetical protein
MNGALLSSCYVVSLLCLLFQMLWCVGEGVCPSIYTRAMAVYLSIFGMETQDTPTQHGAMPLLEEGVGERRQGGGGHP